MAIPTANARLGSIDEQRSRVLSQPWAEGLDPAEVASFLAGLSTDRFAANRFAQSRKRPYLQPRGGFPRFDDQRELSLKLSRAGADFIPLTIDSYTRHNDYDTAAELLQRSEDEEKDYLNGYPLVCHGHALSRELFREIDKPVSLRHGTPDARLLVEIAIATGITDIEGGGVCYCLPYSENFPLDRSLLYWQYVDRTCALYSTTERPIHRESFGPLTATMVPPAMTIAVQLIELLLAAEQGITSMTVSFGQHGSIPQDIATARVLRKLAGEYLERFGFADVRHYLAYHQWMGQFPPDHSRATALICSGALIANLVKADKIITKTVEEALGVPAAETNADAVNMVKYLFDTSPVPEEPSSATIDREATLIESETRSIMEAMFDLPGDQFWQSVYRAFQLGIIDVPFAPHIDNANRLISIRDSDGSIRISEPGNVPIGDLDLRNERKLLENRGIAAGQTYQHLLADINLMA